MRAALLALALAGPAGAEGLAGVALCRAVWADLTARASDLAPLTGMVAGAEDGACVIEDVRLDMSGEYAPDWVIARLRLSGGTLLWLMGEAASPDRLEVGIEGLNLVVATGLEQMDYLLAAQARAYTIRAEAALAWDAAAKTVTVERFEIDFPGDNLAQVTAVLTGVDLSSPGAMQMSATGFALREAGLVLRMHGLFESYVLMAVGESVLPSEGDMEAAMAALQDEARALVTDLPEPAFSTATKAALATLIAELPNPAGTLTLAFRAANGFGPTRFLGYAATGVPDTLAAAAPLLDGVTIEIGWTHEETR